MIVPKKNSFFVFLANTLNPVEIGTWLYDRKLTAIERAQNWRETIDSRKSSTSITFLYLPKFEGKLDSENYEVINSLTRNIGACVMVRGLKNVISTAF